MFPHKLEEPYFVQTLLYYQRPRRLVQTPQRDLAQRDHRPDGQRPGRILLPVPIVPRHQRGQDHEEDAGPEYSGVIDDLVVVDDVVNNPRHRRGVVSQGDRNDGGG